MVFRQVQPATGREDHTQPISGSEGKPVLQTEGKTVTRAGAASTEADFDVDDGSGNDVDLTESDWKLPGDTDLDNPPDIGGADVIAVFIESSDDNAFKVEINFTKADGTTLGKVDDAIDAELSSSSPQGGNHHVYFSALVASDRFELVVTDTSGANQNNVSGSVNVH